MKALFRCDAHPGTGLGHLARCLALAEGLEDRGIRSIFMGSYSQRARGLIVSAGFLFHDPGTITGSVPDLAATRTACREETSFLVVDSYAVGPEYLAGLADAGISVVLVDDFCRLAHYPCDIIVNFTVAARDYSYPAERVRLLLGPAFFPARRALRLLRKRGRGLRDGMPRRLLVSLGGGDPANLTIRVVRALVRQDVRPVLHVVCNQNPQDIERLLDASRGDRVFAALDGLAEELQDADACVTGGGLTKYECAYLGLPQAVVNQTPDQALESLYFAKLGLCLNLGLGGQLDDEALAAGLAAFLGDEEGRKGIHCRSLELFPASSVEALVDGICGWLAP